MAMIILVTVLTTMLSLNYRHLGWAMTRSRPIQSRSSFRAQINSGWEDSEWNPQEGHELCAGPGEWSADNATWLPRSPVDRRASCSDATRRFHIPQQPLWQKQQHAPGPAFARMLLIGDSTMIRTWAQLCGGWSESSGTQVYLEDYFPSTDPRRAEHDRIGCCWRDYLRKERRVPRPHPPSLNATAVVRLPTNLSNPMGLGKAADRRLCPAYGLDIEIIALPTCEDVVRHQALAAHRAPGTYDVIVVNCGLWSAVKEPNEETASRLTRHVDRYTSLLAPLTKALVWVTTSASLDMPEYPQQTEQIEKENESITQMLRSKAVAAARVRQRRGTGVEMFIFDVFKMSRRHDLHADNVHMVTSYYRQLAKFLTHFAQARCFATEGRRTEK